MLEFVCRKSLLFGVLIVLAACAPTDNGGADGVTFDEAETFSEIAADEVVKLAGTEPFWGGEISGDELRYSTPENIDGQIVAVNRFAGNNGLAFSGQLNGATLDLTITPGDCSDAMSDRIYPFVATLKLGEETRHGCAWTEAMPFSGPEAP